MEGPTNKRHKTEDPTNIVPAPADPGAASAKDGPTGGISTRQHVQLDRGTIVGRYVVLELLGAGAMGAVYRAFDPQLDRSIALKVVAGTSGPEAVARLIREAKTLAQLSHPNVVAIHDVGSYGNDVFIAMGLVEGKTLRQWRVGDPEPTVREIIEVFTAAGRGLAVAHGAGIVHRDFKPDNVLLGNDGRVQVVDFGIARAQESSDSMMVSSSSGEVDAYDETSSVDTARSVDTASSPGAGVSLTTASMIVGTPSYMSPEQFLGEPVDARSDQFSFCVALYEALYGKRPFAGRRLSELRSQVLAGELRPPSNERSVPARVRRVVERGLSISPDDRYPSMEALLADLGKDPRATLKRVGIGGGALALASFAVFGMVQARAAEPTLCRGAAEELQGHWDEGRRAEVREAFAASGNAHAEETYERVSRELDSYTEDWVEMRTESCEATNIAGTQSQHLLDLRMRCLDRRLDAVSALVGIFTESVDDSTLEKALPATFELPTLDACADEQALAADIRPPEDPEVRRQVDELRRRLADARALETTGRYRDGLDVIERLNKDAESISYEPLHAEIRLLAGTLHLRSGEFEVAESSLRRAIMHGSKAEDDSLVADAWLHLMEVLSEQAHYERALKTMFNAKAAVARAGDKPLHRGLLARAIGEIHYEKGDYDRAIEHGRLAVDLTESALGTDHPTVAITVNSLGNSYYVSGDHAEARLQYERALAIREKAFGDEHPLVALSVYNLAMLAYSQPDYERSEQMFRRALRLFKKAYGEEHPKTAAAYHGLGVLLSNLGRFGEAEPLLRRSLTLRERILDDQHPMIGSSLFMLGETLYNLERHEEANGFLQRALEVFETKLGPKHPKVAYALVALARARSQRGDVAGAKGYFERALTIQREALGEDNHAVAVSSVHYANVLSHAGKKNQARAHYQRALAIYEAIHEGDHPDLVSPLFGLGMIQLEEGHTAEARRLLERALEIHGNHSGGDEYRAAQIEFALARALWPDPQKRRRAVALAQQARPIFEHDKRPSSADRVARVNAWLSKRERAGLDE